MFLLRLQGRLLVVKSRMAVFNAQLFPYKEIGMSSSLSRRKVGGGGVISCDLPEVSLGKATQRAPFSAQRMSYSRWPSIPKVRQ